MKLAPVLLLLVSVAQAAAGESQPVLLDFHADWCGPCRQMRPAVKALADKGYPVKSIDIDKSSDLADKYEVSAVPTFVVVDGEGRELGRSSGAQPAGQLAKLYNDAAAKAPRRVTPAAERDEAAYDDEEEAEDAPPAEEADAPESLTEEEIAAQARRKPVNPKPWETVVRIRVHGNGSIGFGSGTVIYSSDEESLILTCAHIFKLEGRKQASPDKFPNKITIDLFDGRLKGQQLTCVKEGIPGQAVDYDFNTDVGLIRFKPGRKLPYSRVVPAHWQPTAKMGMFTVGCSEGHDATAWSTVITRPPSRMFPKNPDHLAIECSHAPLQGRSGGGLYTSDGYVAGVCNFAEPQGDHGLYAAPESIYKMLDRNSLAMLYAPASIGGPDTLLADSGGRGRVQPAGRRNGTLRGQSPDREARVRDGDVTIPDPGIVIGFESIPASGRPGQARVQPAGDRRVAWSPTRSAVDPAPKLAALPGGRTAETTDLSLEPEADGDHFPPADFDDEQERDLVNREDLAPRASSRKPVADAEDASGGMYWRPVKVAPDSGR